MNLKSPFKLWYKKKGMTLGDGKKVITCKDAVFALGTLDEEGFVSLYLIMNEWCPQKGTTTKVRRSPRNLTKPSKDSPSRPQLI